jgi:hypothetical protein
MKGEAMTATPTLEERAEKLAAWLCHYSAHDPNLSCAIREAILTEMKAAIEVELARVMQQEGKPLIAAAERLCRIYFEIAAEAIGEDAVRCKRDAALAQPEGGMHK